MQTSKGKLRRRHRITPTKRRKVKCDEEKPTCRRCAKAKIVCDGYEALPKPWLFEPQTKPKTQESTSAEVLPLHDKGSPSSTTASDSHHSRTTNFEVCEKCGQPAPECLCLGYSDESTCFGGEELGSQLLTLTNLTRPRSPYRLVAEQYNFKYFVEVIAMGVARSGISSSFWLIGFPQAAWSEEATRDALLSSAINFRHTYDSLVASKPTEPRLQLSSQGTSYENRAIRSLVSDPPSIEGILMASQAFWLNAMIIGDWGRSLQHSYHSLKLCSTVKDRSKHDLLVMKYAEALAQCCLGYFQITRGPCPIHTPKQGMRIANLLACDASCYIPEENPIEMRIADSLYHLRHVPSALVDHSKALNARRVRHSQHDRLVSLLEKSLMETSMFNLRWSHLVQSNFSRAKMGIAQAKVPFTKSPFPSVLRDLNDLIEKDQDSKVSFIELELRLRVTMPNFSVSTGRNYPPVLADSLSRLLRTDQPSPPSSV